MFLLSSQFQHQHIFYEGHEDERKRTKEKVVDGLQVRHFGHVFVDRASHVADRQDGRDTECHTSGNRLMIDPKTNPRQSND